MTNRDNKLYFLVVGYFIFCWLFLVKNYDYPIIMFCLFGTMLSVAIRLKNLKVVTAYKIFLVIASTLLFYNHFGTFRGILPGVSLLAIMAVVKSLELYNKRDYYIFLLIVELLMVSNFLILESILYIGLILVSTFLLFYIMYLVNRSDQQGSRLKVSNKFVYQIFLFSLLMTIPLFFIFPRLNFAGFDVLGIQENAKTGFAKDLKPGTVAKLVLNNDPVFRVSFEGSAPPREELYWRGEVLNKSDGLNWKRHKIGNYSGEELSEVPRYSYRVSFEDYGSGYVFNLKNLNKIEFQSKTHYYQTHPGFIKAFPMTKSNFNYSSTISSVKRVKNNRNLSKYNSIDSPVSLEIQNLVKKLEAGSLSQKIKNIENFLLAQNLIYTLSPGEYENTYFIRELLLKRKKGFCGHYSSAVANIMRLLNIPSRVISGYQGGKYNSYGDFYTVRNSDAHSWIEYWNPELGWVRFDPTLYISPDRLTLDAYDFFGQKEGADSKVKNESNIIKILMLRFESFYYKLNSDFLGYNLDFQKSFFKRIFKREMNRKILYIWTCSFIAFSLMIYSFLIKNVFVSSDKLNIAFQKLKSKLKNKGVNIKDSDGPIDILSKSKNKISDLELKSLEELVYLYSRLKYSTSSKKDDMNNLNHLIKVF